MDIGAEGSRELSCSGYRGDSRLAAMTIPAAKAVAMMMSVSGRVKAVSSSWS
jgi:hypothetical protein